MANVKMRALKFGKNLGVPGVLLSGSSILSELIDDIFVSDEHYQQPLQMRTPRGTIQNVSWLPHIKYENMAVKFIAGIVPNMAESTGSVSQIHGRYYTHSRCILSYQYGTIELVRSRPITVYEHRVSVYTQSGEIMEIPAEISVIFAQSKIPRPTSVTIEREQLDSHSIPANSYYTIQGITCIQDVYHIEYIDVPVEKMYHLTTVRGIHAHGSLDTYRFEPVQDSEFVLEETGAYGIISQTLGQRTVKTHARMYPPDIYTEITITIITKPVPRFEFEPIVVESDTPEWVQLDARPTRPRLMSASADNTEVEIVNDAIKIRAHHDSLLIAKCYEANMVITCRVPIRVYPSVPNRTYTLCPKKTFTLDYGMPIEFVAILDGARKIRSFTDALHCVDLVYARCSDGVLYIVELYATCTLCVFAGGICDRVLFEYTNNPVVKYVESGGTVAEFDIPDTYIPEHGTIKNGIVTSIVNKPIDIWPIVTGKTSAGHDIDVQIGVIRTTDVETVQINAPYGTTNHAIYTVTEPELIIKIDHPKDAALVSVSNKRIMAVTADRPISTIVHLTMSSGRNVRVLCAIYDPKTPIESRLSKIGPNGPEPEHQVMYEWHADGSAPTVYRNDPPVLRKDWHRKVRAGQDYVLEDGQKFPALKPGELRQHVQTYMDRGVEREHAIVIHGIEIPIVPREAIIVNGQLTWIGPCERPSEPNVGPLHTTITDQDSPWYNHAVQIMVRGQITVQEPLREMPFFSTNDALYVHVPPTLHYYSDKSVSFILHAGGILEINTTFDEFCVYGYNPSDKFSTYSARFVLLERADAKMHEGGTLRMFKKQSTAMQTHINVPERTGPFTQNITLESETGQRTTFNFHEDVVVLPTIYVGKRGSVILTLDNFGESACREIVSQHVNMVIQNECSLWYYDSTKKLCVIPVKIANVYVVNMRTMHIGKAEHRQITAKYGGGIRIDRDDIGVSINGIGDTIMVLVKKPGHRMISCRTTKVHDIITVYVNGVDALDTVDTSINAFKSFTHKNYMIMLPGPGPIDDMDASIEQQGKFLYVPESVQTETAWRFSGKRYTAKLYACPDVTFRGLIGTHDFGGTVEMLYINGMRCSPATLEEIDQDTMPVPARIANYNWTAKFQNPDAPRAYELFYILTHADGSKGHYAMTLFIDRYTAMVHVRRGESFEFDVHGTKVLVDWTNIAGPTMIGHYAKNYELVESTSPVRVSTLYSSNVVDDFDVRSIVTNKDRVIEREVQLYLSTKLTRGRTQTISCAIGDSKYIGPVRRVYLCNEFDLPTRLIDTPTYIHGDTFVPTVELNVKYWIVFDHTACIVVLVSEKSFIKNDSTR